MANGRLEFAERLVELWNSGELETWLDEVGPDFEFAPDPSFPDAGTYSGEEFRQWMRNWVATWRENRFEMLAAEEVAGAMLIHGRWHLATRQTTGEVPVGDFILVLLYDDPGAERPTGMRAFFDERKAREFAEDGTG